MKYTSWVESQINVLFKVLENECQLDMHTVSCNIPPVL